MKKIVNYMVEKYTYDTEDERTEHVKTMMKNGWSCGSKVKEFTGRLGVDDTGDDKNYVWYAEFNKNLI